MKISIQELIHGNVEIMEKEIAIDVIKELIDREIPLTIKYM